MNDLGLLVAAYIVVLGGLLLYVISIIRRSRAARRTSAALAREHERDLPLGAPATPSAPPSRPEPLP